MEELRQALPWKLPWELPQQLLRKLPWAAPFPSVATSERPHQRWALEREKDRPFATKSLHPLPMSEAMDLKQQARPEADGFPVDGPTEDPPETPPPGQEATDSTPAPPKEDPNRKPRRLTAVAKVRFSSFRKMRPHVKPPQGEKVVTLLICRESVEGDSESGFCKVTKRRMSPPMTVMATPSKICRIAGDCFAFLAPIPTSPIPLCLLSIPACPETIHRRFHTFQRGRQRAGSRWN